MQLSDFSFELPAERIAQEPVSPRDAARMFVHERGADESRHRRVSDLADELSRGDLVVVNDTRVLPARLHARRASGGAVELLFLGPAGAATGDGASPWRAMVRPAKKLVRGEGLHVAGGLVAELGERELGEDGQPGPVWTVRLIDPGDPASSTVTLLERVGRMPLPPYIQRVRDEDPRDAIDRQSYQTVFARHLGAVAAPTAGLHFTDALFARLAERGVERAQVTLHVGAGTFLPVTVDDPDEHRMHSEAYELSPETADAVARCRARGGRVVAVGTTSVRVLETCAREDGQLLPGAGETALFLRPGYEFRCVDALLTNFHLPRSTLLMLVAAICGRERVLGLYEEAIERGYRFYSYGDAMLVL